MFAVRISQMNEMIGRTLGHYRIVEQIGAGGMGVVYRAHDERLDRDVAVKVLPEEVSQDADRLARFEREAKLLASLNHPNVATLHGLEEDGVFRFLVMELVEGESLAGALAGGAFPVDEAIPIALQIAEALESAHEHGIVHRDLKPANVMVSAEDLVKVLDFGLAKAFDTEASSPQSPESLAESPTLTADLTRGGVLLGTAAYMSPEQARGKPVDKRADIWAFGCVFYELLTGTRPFAGTTSTESLAAIIRDDPDWDLLPSETPITTRRLLRRCLTKDPRDRLHDIADARIELQSRSVEDDSQYEPETSAPVRTKWRAWLPWGLGAVSAAIAVAVFVGSLRSPSPGAVSKTLVGLEPAEWLGSIWVSELHNSDDETSRLSRTGMTLSPDGGYLVFSAGDDSGSRLYVRAMDEIKATSIPETEGGVGPFFSPNGEWIAFWADGQLKKVRVDGGPAVPVCDFPYPPFGASWGPENAIVFGQWSGGVLRVSANGGAPEEITELAEDELFHRNPQLLPDGETLLFTERTQEISSPKDTRIVAQSLKSGARKILVENGADARYSPTGHLVFSRMGTLVAVPFNTNRLELEGGAVVVLESVRQGVNAGNTAYDTLSGQFSFSPSGTMVYVPGGVWSDKLSSLVWVDREGRTEPLSASAGPYWGPRLSPEGRRVAFASDPFGGSYDIWIHGLSRGTVTRLTFVEGGNFWPLWTPDGAWITFMSTRSGRPAMWWIRADGSGGAERLSTHDGGIPNSWSPDGQVLAFSRVSKSDVWDIWMLPREGEPQPFIESPFMEVGPTFSPDGRWLAYASDQTGRFEVYVTPFPGPGPRVQVSATGGIAPTWARSGRELFYRLMGNQGYSSMWAVDVTTAPRFSVGYARELFRGDFFGGYPTTGYDVTPDGKLFLMGKASPRPEKPVTQLHVTLNWFEELKRLAPAE